MSKDSATAPEASARAGAATPANRIQRNPWIMALAAAPFLLCLLAVVGAVAVAPHLLVLMIHGVALGALSTRYAYSRNFLPRREPVQITPTEGGVRVGRELVADAEIKSGFLVPSREGSPRVKLERRGVRLPVEIEVADEEAGKGLLRHLGLDPTQRVTEFRCASLAMASPWRQIPIMIGAGLLGGLLGGAAALLSAGAATPIGVTTLVVAALVAMLSPSQVRVGMDGVLVSWLGRHRFIPHGEIRSAEVHVRGWGRSRRLLVELGLESGEIYKIPVTVFHWHREQAKLLAQRILEAKAAHDAGEVAEDAALLVRAGRDPGQWLASLRTVTERATHRSAPLRRDRLWRFVEDPSCEPATRAAAAAALSPTLTEADRHRIQAAARTTAAPRLRIALDAVASNEDDAALAEALAELDQERAERETKR